MYNSLSFNLSIRWFLHIRVAAFEALQNFTNIHDSHFEVDPLSTSAENDISTEPTGNSSEIDHWDGENEPDAFTTNLHQPSTSEKSGYCSNGGKYLWKKPAIPRPGRKNAHVDFKATPGVTNRVKAAILDTSSFFEIVLDKFMLKNYESQLKLKVVDMYQISRSVMTRY